MLTEAATFPSQLPGFDLVVFVRTKPLAFRAASGRASAALRLPGTSVMGASEAAAVLLTCQKELF